MKTQALSIVQLKAQIARLRQMQFGQSSEKRVKTIEQLELQLEERQEYEAAVSALGPVGLHMVTEKPYRKPLPDPVLRAEEVHEPACTCPNCGGEMRNLEEDVTEVLYHVPASFKVVRHVRPKLSYCKCEKIVQLPMPSLPIKRGKPRPGLLARVLVALTELALQKSLGGSSTRMQ